MLFKNTNVLWSINIIIYYINISPKPTQWNFILLYCMHRLHYVTQMLCPSLRFLSVSPAEGTKLFDLVKRFHSLKARIILVFFPEGGDLITHYYLSGRLWVTSYLFVPAKARDILSITLWNPRPGLNSAPLSAGNSHTSPPGDVCTAPLAFFPLDLPRWFWRVGGQTPPGEMNSSILIYHDVPQQTSKSRKMQYWCLIYN